MRYSVAILAFEFEEDWQQDVFCQSLFDLGFDCIDGERAYIPTEALRGCQAEFERLCAETAGVQLIEIEECPDENWNAAWEAEHPVQELPLGVRIVPHCAFGAGYHETTSMMIEALMENKKIVNGQIVNVLDHGTGTGVLAIFAKRLGATHVVAVDIDERSVANAQENAELNGEPIECLLEDTVPEGQYDLILANIHRNVLLSNMADYARTLNDSGELWLSGFYEGDCEVLITEAERHGLSYKETRTKGEWRLLRFSNSSRASSDILL